MHVMFEVSDFRILYPSKLSVNLNIINLYYVSKLRYKIEGFLKSTDICYPTEF